jgi:hypothetical protein
LGLWLATRLFGQVEFGVAGGVPLTGVVADADPGSQTGVARVRARTNGFTAGPVVGIRWRGVLLESGFLYRGFRAEASRFGRFGTEIITSNSRFTGKQWEVPVLVKLPVRIGRGVVATVGVGPTFRHFSGMRESSETLRAPLIGPGAIRTAFETDAPESFTRRRSVGAAFEVGLRVRAGRLVIGPALRVTHWDSERTSEQRSGMRYTRPQVDALVSLRYAGEGQEQGVHVKGWEAAALGAMAATPDGDVPSFRFGPTQRVESTRQAAGAALGKRMGRIYSVEGSFLVRRIGYSEHYSDGSAARWRGYAWEVPLLFQMSTWRVASGRLWLGAGPTARLISGQEYQFGSFRQPAGYFGEGSAGVTAVARMSWPAGRFILRPELRYTWFRRPWATLSGKAFGHHTMWLVFGLGRRIG